VSSSILLPCTFQWSTPSTTCVAWWLCSPTLYGPLCLLVSHNLLDASRAFCSIMSCTLLCWWQVTCFKAWNAGAQKPAGNLPTPSGISQVQEWVDAWWSIVPKTCLRSREGHQEEGQGLIDTGNASWSPTPPSLPFSMCQHSPSPKLCLITPGSLHGQKICH
jgi:hypothetical protein